VLVNTEGVLSLVQKTFTVVLLGVFLTAGPVESLLCIAFVVVALETAGCSVGGASDALFCTVQGGLGGVRSDLLPGLGGEVFAERFGHVD